MSDSLERAIGRLEGKVDMILAGQTTATTITNDHEERITKVEKWQAKLIGAGLVIGSIVGFIVKVWA